MRQRIIRMLSRGALRATSDAVPALWIAQGGRPLLKWLPVGNERSECRQPLLTALQQVLSGARVGELLQARRIPALQECVGALLKIDTLFPHADR